MKFKYDPVARALYISVGNGVILNTVELAQDAFIDYSEEHKLIGIELVNIEKKDLEGLV